MYIIGIDGGGTKTKVSLIDHLGVYIGSYTSGPSSIDTVSIDTTIKNIQIALDGILKTHDLEDIQISSVFAGLGGVSSEEDKTLIINNLKLLRNCTEETVINCENDIYNAFTGGTMGKAGIAIIIGTGSVAFGIDEQGMTFRVGGYSYKEGDPGSAYDLGRKSLKTLAKVLDNRLDNTSFTDRIKVELNVQTFSDLVKLFEQLHENRTATADIARFVTEYADKNDKHALRIIEDATDELALMVNAVNKTINLSNKELSIIGSLGNANTIFKTKFYEKILKIDSSFKIHSSMLDPSIGACLLALKNIGIVLTDDSLNRLKQC